MTARDGFEIMFIELGDRLLWETACTDDLIDLAAAADLCVAEAPTSRRAVPVHLD
jgi:hypothetical protein